MEGILRKTVRFFGTLDKWVILVFSSILIIFLGYLDYLSGFEFSFSLFYLLPVSITAWFVNRDSGFIISVFSALAWAISNRLAGEIYSHPGIGYWNTFVRLSIFVIVSQLLTDLKQAIQKERNSSRTDFLTGVTNSRSFFELASIELLRSKRYNRPLTVAYIDLDNFKQINDRFGHATGDSLLRVVAETMLSNLRRTDIVTRMGGDEFVVLFSETNEESAKVAITKLRDSLLETMEQNKWNVTFSIGAITFNSFTGTADELLRQVDELMYMVKAHGKNNIRFASAG
jgi:diguanylate cyclase (GGDEF)-like protein